MIEGIKVVEVTQKNYEQYIEQIVKLEENVLEKMKQEAKEEQFFTTGKKDIMQYILSNNNIVIVAIDKNNNVQSATYLTQGQIPYTYNDITKYFKYGEKYQKYIKDLYITQEEYQKDMIDLYNEKIKAYKIAKEKILNENPKFKNNILQFLESEIKENGFDEKSILREKLNEYMSKQMKDISKYERFYNITWKDIYKETGKDLRTIKENEISEDEEYEIILKNMQFKIYDEPEFEISKYYTANTNNSIEIDTYMTAPNYRKSGLARKSVYEGLKIAINKYFEKAENEEVFLCLTLHKENTKSRNVAEFFGLKDNILVNRRRGIDREVHMIKIKKEEVKEYFSKIERMFK